MTCTLESRPVLAYDVGGSHVSAALCFPDIYRLGAVVSAPHSAAETAELFADSLYELGLRAAGDAYSDGTAGAGLAFPGPFDYAAGISQMRHKLPFLYGFDLRAALADRFGWKPGQVRFLNDAQAFLLGEVGTGAARNAARATGVTLGTGVGSAFTVGSRIVTSGKGVPPGGEIWNLPFEGGIVEDAVSSQAIRDAYEKRTGQHCEVAELALRAPEDVQAREVFAHFGAQLGRAIRRTMAEFAPDVVVLGGGICHSPQLFLPTAEAQLDGLMMELRISTLFEQAALVGAAVAWLKEDSASRLRVLSHPNRTERG